MSTTREGFAASRRVLAFVFVVSLMTVACGGGSPAPDDASTAEQEPRDAQGAPLNEGGGGEALGSPITIPAIVQDQGRPLDTVRAEIEAGIREQCGDGELCVTLVVEEGDETCCTKCEFVRTEPPQQSEVERGTTVVVVSGSLPCSDATDGSEPPDESEAPQPQESSLQRHDQLALADADSPA
jgi:hypothetical protein